MEFLKPIFSQNYYGKFCFSFEIWWGAHWKIFIWCLYVSFTYIYQNQAPICLVHNFSGKTSSQVQWLTSSLMWMWIIFIFNLIFACYNNPLIAQLVERWTVVGIYLGIHRSLVRIRFKGWFFSPYNFVIDLKWILFHRVCSERFPIFFLVSYIHMPGWHYTTAMMNEWKSKPYLIVYSLDHVVLNRKSILAAKAIIVRLSIKTNQFGAVITSQP